MTYRIISFDGGGVRGVYSAVLLSRICKEIPELISQTELFAGTSTGGIIALGLAAGMTANALVDLYSNNASKIFAESLAQDFREAREIELPILHVTLLGPKYDNRALERILREQFNSTRLKDLPKRVLVPSFQLDNRSGDPSMRRWKAKFFHNFPGGDSDNEESVVDVAMRTAAPPIYFPTYDGYIDGGVVANDPSVAALVQALKFASVQTGDIRLFSLGSGTRPEYILGQELYWGAGRWAKYLLDIMIDGVMGVAEFQCRQLLGDKRYFRLSPPLPESVSLDDSSKVDALIAWASGVQSGAQVEKAVTWLRENFLEPARPDNSRT